MGQGAERIVGLPSILRVRQDGDLMAEDVFDMVIHDDETGEVLLHKQLTREQAEQALVNFDIVKDRPHMALIRAVLSAGLYSFNGRSVSA